MHNLTDKFLGSMVGSALGDAIGEVAFRRPDEARLRSWIAQADVLEYTDDTAMALGVAQSLLAVGAVDPQHMGEIFRANYRREPWRGYASGPPTLFSLVERTGLSYTEAARGLFGGQGSFGNGAAMRIAPLGLFFHNSADLYEQAALSAAVTHAHPIGRDGAAILAWAVGQAVVLDPQEGFPVEPFAAGLADVARTPEMQYKLAQVGSLLADDTPPAAVARILGQGVAAHESLPFALYAFLRHPQSFEDCLRCAVLHGGDRDTLGAMACGVSGGYLGLGAIPPAWRERLENREQIEDLARQLAASIETRPTH